MPQPSRGSVDAEIVGCSVVRRAAASIVYAIPKKALALDRGQIDSSPFFFAQR
jgi:hypothetical protein